MGKSLTPKGRMVIHATTFGAKIVLVFWLCLMGFGVFLLAMGPWLVDDWMLYVLAMVPSGLFFVWVGANLGMAAWYTLRFKHEMVVFDTSGFCDRRISPNLIPWADLEWRTAIGGKSVSLMFDVKPAIRQELVLTFPARQLAVLNRLTGYPQFTVMSLGTGKSAMELASLMSQFKPHAQRWRMFS
jgi:hypothetical protein